MIADLVSTIGAAVGSDLGDASAICSALTIAEDMLKSVGRRLGN